MTRKTIDDYKWELYELKRNIKKKENKDNNKWYYDRRDELDDCYL